MTDNIMQILEKGKAQVPNAQQRVADYILATPMEAAFLTLEQLSRAVGTSTTTVIRLCMSLGFSGYSAFQKALQEYIRSRVDPNVRLSIREKDIQQSDLLQKCMKLHIESIRSTVNMIDKEQLERCVEMICRADSTYCLGSHSSYSLGYYLAQRLNQLMGQSYFLDPSNSSIVEQIQNITGNDVAVVFSFPRYVRRTFDVVSLLREQGARIIAIADGYNSPLSMFPDVIVLPCAHDSLSYHNSVVTCFFLVDYLITAIASKDLPATKSRLERAEEMAKSINIHLY